MKLEQHFAKTKAHRRALAMTTLTRRWCYRPRGEERRRAAFPGEVRLLELVGWDRNEQAELWHALLRLGGHYGDGTSSTELSGDVGKSRGEETEKNGYGAGFIARPRSKEKPRSSLPMPARSRRWPRARLEGGGSSPSVRCRPLALFQLITEWPLA